MLDIVFGGLRNIVTFSLLVGLSVHSTSCSSFLLEKTEKKMKIGIISLHQLNSYLVGK